MKAKLITILTLGFLSVCDTTYAHHGTAISYDMENTVTLTGTVTEFRLRNPHSQIYFDVVGEDGTVVSWAGELNSPGILRRAGWTADSIKTGDQVTLSLHPSKAGTPVGVVERDDPMLINGEQLIGTGTD